MSETISQLQAGSSGALADIIPLTQGSSGPGTGTTRSLTIAKILSASKVLYAADPAYGVKADGATNDSNAWNTVLVAAAQWGGIVVAPFGVSIASFSLPSNVTIVGANVQSYGASATGEMGYIGYNGGQGSAALGSVIQAAAGSTAITMQTFSNLYDVQVQGVAGQICIDASAGRATIDNVDCFSGAIGVSCANAAAGSVIRNSRFHGLSTAGISSPNGCLIANNYFNGCGTAINLIAGSNYNQITGNKAAFSANASYTVNSTSGGAWYNVFTGNMSDRPGAAAFSLTYAMMSALTGNGCFRSGRVGSAGNAADAHFAFSNCNGVTVSGNTSSVGTDDGGSGRKAPTNGVYNDTTNTNVTFYANVLVYNTTGGLPISNSTNFPNINTTNNAPFGA